MVADKTQEKTPPPPPPANEGSNQIEAPDEDDLEEFEDLGVSAQAIDPEVQGWTSFAQTTWDDSDLNDTFCEQLKQELEAFKKTVQPAPQA